VQPQQLDALSGWVEQRDRLHAPTSMWTIGQQIEHCCLVIGGVHEALRRSEPPAPPAKITIVRRAVWWTGRIPHGRANAPKSVQPAAVPDRTHLEAAIERARGQVDSIRNLAQDAWFRHFMFDVLRRDEALRFLQIHTNHHLRIMKQIAQRT